MIIEVSNKKLKAALEDDTICLRRYGKPMARFIRIRVDALYAAECLFDFWPPSSKPERVHELSGNLSGIFSIDLQQPYRLLFSPLNEINEAGIETQERWRSIEKIKILKIEDTHG